MQKPITAHILDHLRVVGDISRLEAGALYKSRHLPGIIHVLRGRGHQIESETRHDKTQQRYVRYFYKGATA